MYNFLKKLSIVLVEMQQKNGSNIETNCYLHLLDVGFSIAIRTLYFIFRKLSTVKSYDKNDCSKSRTQ